MTGLWTLYSSFIAAPTPYSNQTSKDTTDYKSCNRLQKLQQTTKVAPDYKSFLPEELVFSQTSLFCTEIQEFVPKNPVKSPWGIRKKTRFENTIHGFFKDLENDRTDVASRLQ